MLQIIEVNPELVKGISVNQPLSLEQVFQFVLRQRPDTEREYQLIEPVKSTDITRLCESAAVNQLCITYLISDDPYILKLYVKLRRNDLDAWLP